MGWVTWGLTFPISRKDVAIRSLAPGKAGLVRAGKFVGTFTGLCDVSVGVPKPAWRLATRRAREILVREKRLSFNPRNKPVKRT